MQHNPANAGRIARASGELKLYVSSADQEAVLMYSPPDSGDRIRLVEGQSEEQQSSAAEGRHMYRWTRLLDWCQ
jgi:hypothetical protein